MATSYSQENRPVRIYTPLPDDELLLHKLEGTESLSDVYRFQLTLVGVRPDIEAEDLVGKAVRVVLDLDPQGESPARTIHGIISRFSFQSAQEGGYTYRAELVPWLWLLSRSSDCRVFQQQNVLEILREVLSPVSIAEYETSISPEDHSTRDFNLQYRETDLAFLNRLFQQEGYFYFFRHEDDRHVLVLTNAGLQSTDCPELEENMRYVGSEDEGAEGTCMVRSWSREQVLQPGALALADYNYEDPRTKLLVNAETSVAIGGNDALEMYDYPGEFDKLGEPTDSKLDFGDEWARLRMEELETRSTTIQGSGTSPSLAPGARFNLVNHVRDSENDQYLVTSVTHTVQQEIDSRPGRDVGGGIEYSNTFSCIPANRKFVPPLTAPKPMIRGPQTAVVVGESDSNPGEVRIDEKGRVKVQFHWDRSEDRNGETSCWIRVSQGWAGAGWGVQFHPRIGHEVIVSFLEGDPDRPIITGRVYNGVNEIPYPEPHQGGVKSRSTPDGSPDNFNEIRFDDTKDEEEFFVQAEKNHTIVVKNDESRTIGNDLGITVEKNRTEKIGENRKLSVGGEKTESVSGPKNISVTKDHTETIDGKMTVTVGKEKELTVAKTLTISSGEDMTISTDKNLSISSTENTSHTVTGDHTLTVEKTSKTEITKGYDLKAKEILIEAEDKITIKVGKAKLIMEKSGDITLDGGKISVKGSGDVKIKGSKVAQN